MTMKLSMIDYRLADQELLVLFAGRPVRRIPYADIASVKKGWTLWNEHWHRRLDFWRSSLTITKKNGIVRSFVITPDDPEAFLSDLQSRVGAVTN